MIAFFHYYHKEFRYAFDAVSIRSEGGIVSKASKGWMADQAIDSETPSKDAPPTTTNRNVPRDLNRLCIEVGGFMQTLLLLGVPADFHHIRTLFKQTIMLRGRLLLMACLL